MDEKPKKKNKPVSDFDALHSIAVATGAGFTLLSSIGVGVWLGLKCDEYFWHEALRIDCSVHCRCRQRTLVRRETDAGEIN